MLDISRHTRPPAAGDTAAASRGNKIEKNADFGYLMWSYFYKTPPHIRPIFGHFIIFNLKFLTKMSNLLLGDLPPCKFVFLLQKCHCKIWLGRLGIGYAKNTCLSFMRQFVIKSMIVKWNPVSLKKDGRGRMRDWGELLLCWGFDFVQFSLFLISYLFFVFLLKFTKFWGSQILAFYKKLWEMPQLIS